MLIQMAQESSVLLIQELVIKEESTAKSEVYLDEKCLAKMFYKLRHRVFFEDLFDSAGLTTIGVISCPAKLTLDVDADACDPRVECITWLLASKNCKNKKIVLDTKTLPLQEDPMKSQ